MGVLRRFISLSLVIIAAAAGAVGHVAAAAGAEEAIPVRPVAVAVGKVVVQQSGTTLCCSNMTGYHECVEACLDYYPREQAVQICDPGCQEAYQCHTVSGDECPSSHLSSSDHRLITNSVAAAGEAQLAAADGTLCCSNMTLFHECVEDCFAYYPREQAVEICDPGCKEAYQCHTVSGDECPSGHRSSGLLTTTHSAERAGNVVDHCLLGCKSSVCSKMVTGAGSKGVLKLHALQRCNKACYKLCAKSDRARTETSTA